MPEGARAAGGPARRERAVRVHDLDRDRCSGRRWAAPRSGCSARWRPWSADAVSYLLSALGIRAIGGERAAPARAGAARLRAGDLLDGWRYILGHPALRPLFFNTVLVNGLIMATAPLLAVLMLGELGLRALAVRPRLRRALRRRPGRLAAVPAARRAVRAAPGPAHRRDAARVLVGRAGLRRPGRRRARAGDGRRARAGHLHGRVQPGVRHLPARADRDGPGRPHAVRVVGDAATPRSPP